MKRDLAGSERKLNNLQSEWDILMQDRDAIVAQLNMEEERVEELNNLRNMNER